MSLYASDLQNDLILSAYLDERYRGLGITFQRVNDLTQQHQGVDILLSENGKVITVDEKAQMHYLNKSLPTFAFEIGYLKNGVPHKGWLFDEQKTTEVYFLIVHIYTDGERLTSPSQIKSCKILRIDRKALIGALAQWGLDSAACYRAESNARKNGLFGKIPIPGERRFSFNRTQHLVESPFNIVIRLDMLATIGQWL